MNAYEYIIPFFQSDLDLDSMTLILKLDLDIIKINIHSMARHSKFISQTDGHTDRQTV